MFSLYLIGLRHDLFLSKLTASSHSGDIVVSSGEHLAWGDTGGRPYISSNGAGTLVLHSTGSTLFTVPSNQAIAFQSGPTIATTCCIRRSAYDHATDHGTKLSCWATARYRSQPQLRKQ